MTTNIEADICVIGAGSGGLSVAAGAAKLGARTVLIERGPMGGDCLNFGCVPSKALIAAARQAAAGRDGAAFGVSTSPATVDFARVHAHIHEVIATIAPNDSVERFSGLGATVIQGTARFTGRSEVVADGRTIRARRFVIATGSAPAIPPIPGLENTPYLTNETVFDLRTLPYHLIIIGGGAIGCELAQAYRRLGAKVTVLTLAFLEKEDPELAKIVLDRLRAEDVWLYDRVAVSSVAYTDNHFTVNVRHDAGRMETVRGSHLLIATGRRPNTDDLGLEAAGVVYDRRGVTVDRRLRTSNKRIYAVGDVTGRFQFTHMAGEDAGIVIRNALFRLPAKTSDNAVPWVTFTDPELAQIGLSEAAARAAGYGDLSVLRLPFAENDRAQTDRVTEGLIKVIATKRGRILGAAIAGPGAGELIQPWALAISQGLKLAAIARYIAPYPTLGEASKRVAASFYAPKLFSPSVKKLVAFLAKFK